ncbi:MAG TPA: ferritin-like domain-containing protein [Saprospiraceae bacterium]|nr:ferritin-like domain-containing protein [Saprospiraceae bacterium]HND89942.1 ferritin-like domain-containing protein [Saprospiraceae bacterium]
MNTTKKKLQETEVSTLHDLIVAQLQDVYWAEEKILDTLPDMVDKAQNEDLKAAFKEHLEQTKAQVTRLKQVFEVMGEKAKAKKCEAMAGLAKEVDHMIEETPEQSAVRDCALIVGAQKVEHYEIATYGCLRTLARIAGNKKASALLQETLDEEHAANDHLTQLAEAYVNEDAKQQN